MSGHTAQIPAGWLLTTLGEVLRWGSGGTPRSSERSYYGGNIPWAVIGDLDDGPVSVTAATITELGMANSPAKLVQPGSVLLAMYGSIGKLGIATVPLATNQAIAFTDPRPIDPKYLFWYLRLMRDELIGAGKGGTQQNISQTVIKSFPFLLAPLAEQHRIVAAIEEHLSRLDAAVAGLERVKVLLPRYRAAVLKAAVEGRLGEGTKSGWLETPLEELALDEPGALTDGPFGSKLKTSHYTTAGPRVIRLQNIGDGHFIDEAAHISQAHFETLRRHEVRAGDVVIAGLGESLPRVCIIPDGLGPAIVKADCFKLRPDPSKVRSGWLNIVLNSDPIRQRAATLIKGVGRPRLSLGVTRRLIVDVPPLEVQDRIIGEVEQALSVINATDSAVDTELARAARLRQSILARAFRGELVPQDPSDEPAEALLERIRAERGVVGSAKPTRAPRSKNVAGRGARSLA